MSDLSIFVDESGDSGNSKYYLITLIFHDQGRSIQSDIERYQQTIQLKGLSSAPFHLSPIINGHDAFSNMGKEKRKQQLSTFRILALHLPYSYQTFAYKKAEVGDALEARMKRDLILYLFDNLSYFQSFDHIKLYYDNGQRVVTSSVRGAIEYALGKEATIYRDASPSDYLLSQLADYVCGIELTALKYTAGEQTNTDLMFFGDKTSFKKNWLRRVRRNRLG